MAPQPGNRLGPYEIQSLLGAGGMGEVYRARDTRLDRTVAIKVLPPHLAADPQFRERFEREARAVAALNHPHICVLHDVGHQDGTDFLVMEYLDGDTLAKRLEKGALPLDQALRYAIEIADALDKAHTQGITHRDLKPGNIMITKTGAKLLDFGLAKASPPSVADGGLSMLPTTPPNLTAQGTILGTFQYMAPEQLEGKEADARTDIFAFGALVYEMVTGKKAFEGKTQASLIGAIMHAEPAPIAQVQPITPPALDRLVKVCLAKDPDERWQSVADLTRELRWIAAEGMKRSAATTTGGAQSIQRVSLLWSAAVAIALVAGAVGGTLWRGSRSPDLTASVSRFVLPLPDEASPVQVNRTAPAFSLDGTRLVYVVERNSGLGAAPTGTGRQLYVRSLDSVDPRPVRGTAGGSNPFFSPDGRSIGFFADGKLKRIAIDGGTPVDLCDAEQPGGGTWAPDGTIVFSAGARLFKVASAGGSRSPLTEPNPGATESRHSEPQILPDGRTVLFTISKTGGRNDLAVVVLEGGAVATVLNDASHGRYASGHLVFWRDRRLFAVPFALGRDPAADAVVPIAEDAGNSSFTLSSMGSLAYVSAAELVPGSDARSLIWVDRRGQESPVRLPVRRYAHGSLSPNGNLVAVRIADDRQGDIWVGDLNRGTLTRLTANGGSNPTWSSDGKYVTYKFGADQIIRRTADGSGPEEVLWRASGESTGTTGVAWLSWSPDGRTLAVQRQTAIRNWDIWLLRQSRLELFDAAGRVPRYNARISPDGRWISYTSDESGQPEVYVQPFPTPGGRIQISTDGGNASRWSPSGRELFYLRRSTLMAVPISTAPTFKAALPTPLFEVDLGVDLGADNAFVDVAPDGQRFLSTKRAPDDLLQRTPPKLYVVLNWTAGLRK